MQKQDALTNQRDIVHGRNVKTAARLRLCTALTQELNERLSRAYVFAQLDEPGRTLFLKAEKALLAAQEAFAALASYEEERR